MDYTLFTAAVVLLTSGLCAGQSVLPPGPLTGAIGGRVKFTTTLSPPAKPFVSVSWTFNRVNIITSTTVNITNADHKERISLDRTTGSLELWNLGLRDQGEYRVSIIPDGALELQGATTLDVYVLLSAATITSPPATLIAGISSTNLTCEAAGNISSIQWIKDGLPLSPSNNITFSADNRTVYLSPVQVIDNGEYECLVSNRVSNWTASHNLTVNFGPQNISIDGPSAASTGRRVTLSCSADSIPPATFTWMFNRTEMGVNNTLYVIERMEALHIGNYTCTATNNITGLKDSVVYKLRASSAAPIWSFALMVTSVLAVGLLQL
ncbi:HEPACAM family member 2-like [Coregonus clupeaformis]|uniref:HEPACAM family member 2-like n=1 Tax=Coregonus clupeaformis TaxID=59861 RepID=UPI001BE03714|nr:HEPACAM family member 2-like [Coregonus clupeaformis]